MTGVQLLVLAKAPVPGRVKTRLCPPYTAAQASRLAAAALDDTLDAVLATDVARRVLVLAGALDGVPAGLDVQPQRGEGLAERIAAAFDDAWAALPVPLLLVGMDTPQLTAAELGAAAGALLEPAVDAVLGAAADGGWWALGLRRPDPGLLLGVPMSTAHTGRVQLARLVGAGLRVHELPELVDVDTAADARRVAAAAPGSRFAALVDRFDTSVGAA